MALPFATYPVVGFGALLKDADNALVVRDIGAAGGGSGSGFALPNTAILAPTGLFNNPTSGPGTPWALQKVLGCSPTPNTYLQFVFSPGVPGGGETSELDLLAYPTLDYEVNYPYGLQFAGSDTLFIVWSSTPGIYTPGPYGSFRMIITIP